jgi:hypothetical protein
MVVVEQQMKFVIDQLKVIEIPFFLFLIIIFHR